MDKIEFVKDIQLLDSYVMGEQNMIYKSVEYFLKSDEAKQFNITGVNFSLDKEGKYVNAEWKFNNR